MKSYIVPGCRIIDLLSENMVATSPSLFVDDSEENSISNEGEFLSGKKNIWGDNGIWK